MSAGDIGTCNSKFWTSNDAVSTVSGSTILDLGEVDSNYNAISTFNYPGDIGIAWVESHIGVAWTTFHAKYINASGTAVDEEYSFNLPWDHICLSMQKVSKYGFRLFIQEPSAGGYTFYTVDARVSGSYTEGAKYSLSGSNGGFNYNCRSGDRLLGLRRVEESGGTEYVGRLNLFYLYADMSNGTFTQETSMWSLRGSDGWWGSYLPPQDPPAEWVGWECPGANIAELYQMRAEVMSNHYGDDGFIIRLGLNQISYFKEAAYPSLWYCRRYAVKTFEWAGWYPIQDNAHRTEKFDTTYPRKFCEFDPSIIPLTHTHPNGDDITLQSLYFNSYHTYTYWHSELQLETGTYTEYSSGSTAYPRSTAYSSPPSLNTMLTETGDLLLDKAYTYEGSYLYVTDVAGGSRSEISQPGYVLSSVFNRLDTSFGSIMCWGHLVSGTASLPSGSGGASGSWWGIIEFSAGLNFLEFHPLISGTWTGTFGADSVISNGFLVINTMGYYVGGGSYGSMIKSIIEQN